MTVVDVHVHVFPPEVIKGIGRYLQKDEFLKEICNSPVHRYATAEDLIQKMEQTGVEVAAASGFASYDHGLCREMNNYVLDAAQRYPGRILPMVSVCPHDPGMIKEIVRCKEAGAVGVGELFPWGQNFALDGREANRLAAVCLEQGLPLLLHVNETVGHDYVGKGDVSIEEAADFAAAHPDLTLILPHWGGGLIFYELMPQLKRQLRNVYYDTAAGPFLYDPKIYQVVKEIGVLHKVLLGTDYPLISPARYLKEIKNSSLTEEEAAMVCGENARKLFSLF